LFGWAAKLATEGRKLVASAMAPAAETSRTIGRANRREHEPGVRP